MKNTNLDQFYTKQEIAKNCIDLVYKFVPKKNREQFLEPGAGTGSFSNNLKNCVSIDIDPKLESIFYGDFLKSSPQSLNLLDSSKVCTIGNPPFGRNASVAVKFFNQATNFSDYICFILPKTFKKRSIIKRLNLNFHLVHEWDLPKKSFIFENDEYDVPCVFQIWMKKKKKRVIETLGFINNWFSFVSKNNAEAAIRRVGGRSGLAYFDFEDAAESSHYFIKSGTVPIKDIVKGINSIDFSKIVNSTVGVRSLSKFELLKELNKIFKSN